MIKITNITLIQELRAVHALSELININIDASEEHKYYLLKTFFNMKYSLNAKNGINGVDIIQINHSLPLTSIFSIEKPLIFPKVIINYLKESWPKSRKFEYSFSGLISPERKKIIENWLFVSFHKQYILNRETYSYRLKRKIFFKLNIHKPLIKKFGKFSMYSSNKGRIFPDKSWDDDYYNFLLKSKFVLCPNGVYTWTYRFFETILCGAIPIVEKHSPAYTGFKYYTMDEKLSNLLWSKEIAEYNFKLCIERITLSEEDSSSILNEIIQLNKNNIS